MSNTKIIVLRSKQIMYVGVFLVLVILLLLLLFFMSRPQKISSKETASISKEIETNAQKTKSNKTSSKGKYKPGIYSSTFSLGESKINLEISVDANHINSVKLKNMSETVSTMYPLIKPSIKRITKQLQKGVSPDEVVLSKESQYTEKLILDSITTTLNKAQN